MNRLILISMLFGCLQLQARHQRMNLQKAIDKKLVKAKARSLGGYQGSCIVLNVRNLSPDSLLVIVEPGRRLNSIDDKFQDILVTREELIVLRRGEEKNQTLKGYCCQASNCAPYKDAAYDVNKLADSGLVTLARYLSKNCFDAGTEQHAIWAISNGHATAGVTGANDSLLLPLRSLVAAIKGEQLPWYSVVCGTYVYPNGRILNYPVALRGRLNYSNDMEDYVSLCIYNDKGLPVCLVRSQWLKAGSDLNYELNIPLKNLSKGKYTVALRTDRKELIKKEFEI